MLGWNCSSRVSIHDYVLSIIGYRTRTFDNGRRLAVTDFRMLSLEPVLSCSLFGFLGGLGRHFCSRVFWVRTCRLRQCCSVADAREGCSGGGPPINVDYLGLISECLHDYCLADCGQWLPDVCAGWIEGISNKLVALPHPQVVGVLEDSPPPRLLLAWQKVYWSWQVRNVW